jgi:hypothetical protein
VALGNRAAGVQEFLIFVCGELPLASAKRLGVRTMPQAVCGSVFGGVQVFAKLVVKTRAFFRQNERGAEAPLEP